jgi:hypothetical protein
MEEESKRAPKLSRPDSASRSLPVKWRVLWLAPAGESVAEGKAGAGLEVVSGIGGVVTKADGAEPIGMNEKRGTAGVGDEVATARVDFALAAVAVGAVFADPVSR